MRIHGDPGPPGRGGIRRARGRRSCCPRPAPYDVPLFSTVKVHRDFHIEVASRCTRRRSSTWAATWTPAPTARWGKLYHRGQLVKPIPAARPSGSPTPPTCPSTAKTIYTAMRDVISLAAAARRTATASVSMPTGCWTPTRRGRRCGRPAPAARPGPPVRSSPVDTACQRALDLDVVNVTKIHLDAGESDRGHAAATTRDDRQRPVRPRQRVPGLCS